MDNDISKRTVLVLLILTLVVSVVGTWTILSMPNSFHTTYELNPEAGGEVRLGVVSTAPPVRLSPVDSGGEVSLNIAK